ncbi:MAG: glutamyl-tRNA synthetase [Dehalococcoidia bacterium SG8_51_3]|nr:MAG: glutamyl-tRNA synthetase [Dehalococcoidia bacterium SG8_51_3]
MSKAVRVRFAPSPTGFPHVGNIRTALFNWLYARHTGGTFIVRIEDTDIARKVKGALEGILGGLRWLGLDWDEGPEVGGKYGPYFQSQRLDLYREAAKRLVVQGDAYYCYCSPERLAEMRAKQQKGKQSIGYDRHCRDLTEAERQRKEKEGITPVVRFKMPLEGQTSFNDIIWGEVTVENSTLDDYVLLKSDGYPTYHLANVVDDHLMEISHVLRAEEWLSSVPRHKLLYEALGYEMPLLAHLPMILGPDRSKLSKRHGAVSITEYKGQGYLPEAMVNFLALLGWSLDDRTDIIKRDELIKHFSLERISRTAAVFNHEKLDWMNGAYLREMEGVELLLEIMPFLESGLPREVKRPVSEEYVSRIVPLIRERINTLAEAATYADFFFLNELGYDASLLVDKKMTAETTLRALKAARDKLSLMESFDHDSLEGALRPLAEELGLKAGQLFNPLRVATTGRTAAPPLFETMAVLGKEICLKRIGVAIGKLGNNL